MKFHLRYQRLLSLVALIALFSVLGVGCAPSIRDAINTETLTSPISKNRPIRVDSEASEIIWSHPVNVRQFRPRELRREIAQALEEALNGTHEIEHGDQGYDPARYRLEVHEIDGTYIWALFPCLVYLTIFGCPTHSLYADITLSLEYRGKVYSTSVEGDSTFNLYTMLSFQGASEVSPVASAIRVAIRRLAKRMRDGATSSMTPKLQWFDSPKFLSQRRGVTSQPRFARGDK